MDAGNNILGPQNISGLGENIGKIIIVEDFAGNKLRFKLWNYSGDNVFLEYLDGEYKGTILEVDLGVSSITPIYIKTISSQSGEILFSEDAISKENVKKEAFAFDVIFQQNRNTLLIKLRLILTLPVRDREEIARQGILTKKELNL